jgi:tetratricopeptide (TPR) repeat protein
MSHPRRTRLEEQRDLALEDLLALERQVTEGEIDATDAELLRSRYEADAADAMRSLDALEERPERDGRSPGRIAMGIGAFVVAAVVVTVALVNAVEPRPEGGFVTGGIAADVSEQGGVDLATVTNEEMEAVVAANPEVVPMRMALARRYVEDGDFSSALGHYMYVLEREENPEALMYVGWMTFVSGDPATGAAFIEQSLDVAPGDPVAQWFLANVYLYGLEDAAAAIPLLESVIDSGLAPPDVVEAAENMLSEARA